MQSVVTKVLKPKRSGKQSYWNLSCDRGLHAIDELM